jgi:hypothetical protein
MPAIRWWAQFDRPLGAPLGPAIKVVGDNEVLVYERRFATGTSVRVDLSRAEANISWGHCVSLATVKQRGMFLRFTFNIKPFYLFGETPPHTHPEHTHLGTPAPTPSLAQQVDRVQLGPAAQVRPHHHLRLPARQPR